MGFSCSQRLLQVQHLVERPCPGRCYPPPSDNREHRPHFYQESREGLTFQCAEHKARLILEILNHLKGKRETCSSQWCLHSTASLEGLQRQPSQCCVSRRTAEQHQAPPTSHAHGHKLVKDRAFIHLLGHLLSVLD